DNYVECLVKRERPSVLVIPGGGYEFVSQRESEPIALAYMANHFNSFVLDYSCAPKTHYPTQLIEASMAMAYIRENREKYHLTDKVSAVGFSAGGHLCACLATIFDDENIIKALGEERAKSVRPDAVILSYAVISSGTYTHGGSFNNLCLGDTFLMERLSLEKRVTEKSSPAFIWHTADDSSVPVENSLLLASAYANHKVPFALHIFEKGRHGSSTVDMECYHLDDMQGFSIDCHKWLQLSVNFLTEHEFVCND
ncbi:MAG: alpha/beta hydrolase, partial [Clostridia bacterium]